MRYIVLLIIFATGFSFAKGNFETLIFEGIPVIVVGGSSDICQDYNYKTFRILQAEYGKEVANSALHCKFYKIHHELAKNAFVKIDPMSKCGLMKDQVEFLIDPCSGRQYGQDGECKSQECETNLVQLFVQENGEVRFLIKEEELIEFVELKVNTVDTPEEALAKAMINNSDSLVDNALNNENFDVDCLSKLKVSLIEIAILTRNVDVLKYLLSRNAKLCKSCDNSEALLRNSLKSGSFDVSRVLINYGISTENICSDLDNFPQAKLVANCKQ